MDRQKTESNHTMEQDLRMCLNILLNFLIYNNDDPTVAHEFTKG